MRNSGAIIRSQNTGSTAKGNPVSLRLELCGATLLANLLSEAIKVLDGKAIDYYT